MFAKYTHSMRGTVVCCHVAAAHNAWHCDVLPCGCCTQFVALWCVALWLLHAMRGTLVCCLVAAARNAWLWCATLWLLHPMRGCGVLPSGCCTQCVALWHAAMWLLHAMRGTVVCCHVAVARNGCALTCVFVVSVLTPTKKSP